MAKVIYHVTRVPTCAPADLESALATIARVDGEIVSIAVHSTIDPNKAHNNQYCVTDVVYSIKLV